MQYFVRPDDLMGIAKFVDTRLDKVYHLLAPTWGGSKDLIM